VKTPWCARWGYCGFPWYQGHWTEIPGRLRRNSALSWKMPALPSASDQVSSSILQVHSGSADHRSSMLHRPVIVSTVLRDALREGTTVFHLIADYSICRGNNATTFGQRSWVQTPARVAGECLASAGYAHLLNDFDPVKGSQIHF
jgi:hypothetical protein